MSYRSFNDNNIEQYRKAGKFSFVIEIIKSLKALVLDKIIYLLPICNFPIKVLSFIFYQYKIKSLIRFAVSLKSKWIISKSIC